MQSDSSKSPRKPTYEPIVEDPDDIDSFHEELDNPIGPPYTGQPEGLHGQSKLPETWTPPKKEGEKEDK